MKTRKKIILIILFFFAVNTGFSQYNYLEVSLEISRLKNIYNLMNFKLFRRDTIYFIEVKSRPGNDDKKWAKSKIDTIYTIGMEKFNEIAEMVSKLSSEQILKGMHPSIFSIGNDGNSCVLKLTVIQSCITYNIWSPNSKTKERNLEPFFEICKKILLLARLNPKEIF